MSESRLRSNLTLIKSTFLYTTTRDLLLSIMTKTTAIKDWRTTVAQKREQLASAIPSEWRLDDKLLASLPQNGNLIEADIPRRSGILSKEELQITEIYTAEGLLQQLAAGGLSSLAVTTAFCKRAAIAQQLVRLSRHLETRSALLTD